MKTRIITHRGLDPSIENYYAESSVQAFRDQLSRGYGLEFDVQFTLDDVMIAVHDATLKRISGGKDERKIRDVKSADILSMKFLDCSLTTVPEILRMIERCQAKDAISAVHLKSLWQEPWAMDILLVAIKASGISPERFIIFDMKPKAAEYIKSKMPELRLAASVSHPYDIERYNRAVGGTLMSLDELVGNRHLYSWAWLDEWDLTDRDGARKKLCTAETFKILRDNGIKIALVTPELHTKSPGLLGGEAHEDGLDPIKLALRFSELEKLNPDAVCTDHPDQFKAIIK